MSVAIRAAWIGAGAAVFAAIIAGGLAFFTGKGDTTYNNSGQQVVGDGGTITINNPTPKKIATIELLSGTDVHLGDNVYPDTLGRSYNPLTQDIYPQPVEGILFFDKDSGGFIADKKGATQIGVAFSESLKRIYSNYDFSSYKHVFATNPGDKYFEELTARFKGSDKLVFLGPTALVA